MSDTIELISGEVILETTFDTYQKIFISDKNTVLAYNKDKISYELKIENGNLLYDGIVFQTEMEQKLLLSWTKILADEIVEYYDLFDTESDGYERLWDEVFFDLSLETGVATDNIEDFYNLEVQCVIDELANMLFFINEEDVYKYFEEYSIFDRVYL